MPAFRGCVCGSRLSSARTCQPGDEKVDNVEPIRPAAPVTSARFHWCRGVCVKRLLGSALGTSAGYNKIVRQASACPTIFFALRSA